MKNDLRKSISIIFLVMLLGSCKSPQAVPSVPTEEEQATPGAVPATVPPTIVPTLTPTATPYPIPPADATLQAFDSLCLGTKEFSQVEISPNGAWIAVTCYAENGKEESPLQVISMDRTRDWKIYYSDHIFSAYLDKIGLSLDRHDEVHPNHYSKDGRFLFATVRSRLEGCCWIGGRYVLLVRLNLETGEQIPLLRTDYYSGYSFDFIISEDDRYLLFSPPSDQPYDFAILDFQTWETQQVFLKFKNDIDVAQARISPDAGKVILPLFKQLEFNDYYVSSVALIDLITGDQKILISDLTPENELFPVRWVDNRHVLLSNINPVDDAGDKKESHWLLDISSGQLEKEAP